MCFSGTEEHLRAKYRSSLHLLEPIPGEQFSVSLDDKDLMMTAKFESCEIDLESRENKDMIRYYQKLDTEKGKYKPLKLSELGDVFNSMGEKALNVGNLQGNLITLIGDPGVGKTTAVQRLAWDWVKKKGGISKKYKLVFFIPVRHVRKDSLMDVLSELKLVPDPMSDGVHNLHDLAKDTLFILDGADENDITGDLHRLITGELYPDSTVLLTARPEAKCFMTFPVIPCVRVTLLGTDDETVDRYMRVAVSPSSEEEWKSFQDNYQEKMPDTSLLNIPLYLCILCAVFKANIASGLKCTNLKIPESTTELFNAFLHVIIRRWLDRRNMNRTVNFEKSPLDPNSNIPAEIKMILYFIGKLCYRDLTQPTSNYQFTDTQAGECLLDMQFIKDCGLFNVGKSGKNEIFYVKHKQLQEYLAALYLSHEGTKEHIFHEFLHLERNKGLNLLQVMRSFKAVQLVQFACGLSGDFLKSVLHLATSRFSLLVQDRWISHVTESGTIPNIQYEAVLFTEHHSGDLPGVRGDDLHGFMELKKYLLGAQIHKNYENDFLRGEKCLRKLCGLFDKALALQLLSRFYGLHLKPVGGEKSVNYEIEGQSGSEIDLSLDQLQTELLNSVCISSVQSVRSFVAQRFVDIPGLLETFPHLNKLCIAGGHYIPYCSSLRSERDMCTSLTSFTLKGEMHHASSTLLKFHVHSLLQQSQLSSLVLFDVSILTVLACTTQPLWSHLQYLSLRGLCESEDDGTGMHRLLQSSRHSLTQCDLDILVAGNILPLIEEGIKSLTCLQKLSLELHVKNEPYRCTNMNAAGNVFPLTEDELKSLIQSDNVLPLLERRLKSLKLISEMPENDKPYNLCDTLQRVLPHLNTLHTLSVDYSHVCHKIETFVETVCGCTNIRTLTLYKIFNLALPQQCREKLTQHGVKVNYK